MSQVLFPQPISLDGYQTLLGSCSDLEQLRVSNGNLVRRYTVANIATVGPALRLALTHNSIDNFLHPTMPAGRNWRHIGMANLTFSTNLVSFTDENGRVYDYVPGGSGWKRHDNSLFLPMDLSQVGSNWHLAGLANGNTWIFNAQGQLLSIVDSHNQALTFHYNQSGDQVTSISEPTGRSLLLAYANGRLASITDPRGLVTTLGYDNNQNLTSITGPEGCQISYGYAPGSTNGLILSRTDALNNLYSYSYYSDGSLHTVTNPASHSLSYSYQAEIKEYFDNTHTYVFQKLTQTLLTDAHNQLWDYRFDQYQNLWRIIDPLKHTQQFYWSLQQQLLFASQGYYYPTMVEGNPGISARPHLYNRLQRNVFDSLGNQTLSIDANGQIDEMEYDSQSRLVAMTPGRATLAIGGEWLDHFGKDGFLLCAADDTNNDLFQRPSYVASQGIQNGDDQGQKGFIRSVMGDSGGVPYQILMQDSRVPWIRIPGDPARNSYRRSPGKWRTPDTTEIEFNFRIPISQTGGFNLSFYTHCIDQNLLGGLPSERYYQEFFGRDLEFTVVDRDPSSGNSRTQSFRLPNTAAGVWITFSVYQVANAVISVKVSTYNNSDLAIKHPAISCIAFDPLDSRRSTLSYDPNTGDLLQWKDPLGQPTSLAYNSNGTLDSLTDPKQRLTKFFYGDLHQNLTRILDAGGGNTLLGYDANGNIVSAQDPDGRTTLMDYDGKNRLVRVEDALGHQTFFDFDSAGNLSLITDAKGRETRLFYNNLNRLVTIRDPLLQEVLLGYDASGRLNQVTDALNRTVVLSYDLAGRPVEVLQPDQQKVALVFNAINRLVAITGPNGTRANWEQIHLEGALNILDNPSIEMESTAADYPNRPQRWSHSQDWYQLGGRDYPLSHQGPNPKPKPRSNAEAHSGSYSLELEAEQNWSQREIPSFAGGRYLAKAWAKKAATGAATVVTELVGMVRNAQAQLEVQETPGQETSVANNWSELKPQLIQIPGDTQASRTQPPMGRLELRCHKTNPSDPSTPTYFDDIALSLLNTCLQYDGENLREVVTPDGARFVRDFDRFGRLSRLVDPQGRSVSFHYDTLDRLIRVQDSLGHSLLYGYDPVGQLISFTDARGQIMTFAFDALDRLLSITYPDSTSENFTYSPAGDLLTYRDNQNRLRSFGYDFIHRLILITYPDSQTLALAYDEVSNLTLRTERNGDQELYSYDALDRPTSSRLIPALGSPSRAWQLQSGYDAVGNRNSLSSPGAVYGVGKYGQDNYFSPYWSVPTGGFDSMNRLLTYVDSRGNSSQIAYDIEGRRTELAPSNGTLTSAAYDIVGKLLSLTTSKNSQELLRLVYDYNQAADRRAQQSDKASCTYQLDQAGRLVQETQNCWVTQWSEHLGQGELESCLLDRDNQRIQLLGLSDNFSKLQLDRWTIKFQEKETGFGQSLGVGIPVTVPPYHTGMRLRADQGLHMLFPSAWMNVTAPAREKFNLVRDPVGYFPEQQAIQTLELKRGLTGDLDLVLEWDGFDIPVTIFERNNYSNYDPQECFLKITLEPASGGASYWLQRGFERADYSPNSYPNNYQWSYNNATTKFPISNPLEHEAGKFRLKRSGDAFELFYWNATNSTWALCSGAIASGFPTGELRLSIRGLCKCGSLNYRLTSLTQQGSDFPTTPGRYTSVTYDAGQSVPWNRLSWEETLPANTDIQVQVACSNSPSGPWTFRGPDSTSASYFTTPAGETLPVGANFTGRYCRYQVTLSSNGLATPSFGNLYLSFGGGGMLASSCRNFTYDPAGNVKTVTTITDSGTTVDDRNPAANPINSLNQIKGRVVGGVTWTYSYDLNGNLTGKSNGIATWTYTWSDDNRLTRVQGPGVDVSYTYDVIGRMLSRTQGGVVTTFVWDGWTCVREVTAGANTVYHIPDGVLHSFVVAGKVYQCHLDALGSVRMITDEAGTVVARFEYGAWGEEVFSSVSPALAGFAYRFVGGLGVRTDSVTGLVYMRERWYDPGLMRFVSRDPIGLGGGANLYIYAGADPLNHVDPSGLQPGPYPMTRFGPTPRGISSLRGVGPTSTRYIVEQEARHVVEQQLRPKLEVPGQIERGGRGRFRNGADEFEQLEGVRSTQKLARQQARQFKHGKGEDYGPNKGKIVDCIGKSTQRTRNGLKSRVRNYKDGEREYIVPLVIGSPSPFTLPDPWSSPYPLDVSPWLNLTPSESQINHIEHEQLLEKAIQEIEQQMEHERKWKNFT